LVTSSDCLFFRMGNLAAGWGRMGWVAAAERGEQRNWIDRGDVLDRFGSIGFIGR
jgi:hypothetical protein